MSDADNLRQQFQDQASIQLAEAMNACYWRMISHGMLPSRGWRIGHREVWTGPILRFEVFPIPPTDA